MGYVKEGDGHFCQCCEQTVDKLHRFCLDCQRIGHANPESGDYSLMCAGCFRMFHRNHLPLICMSCWKGIHKL